MYVEAVRYLEDYAIVWTVELLRSTLERFPCVSRLQTDTFDVRVVSHAPVPSLDITKIQTFPPDGPFVIREASTRLTSAEIIVRRWSISISGHQSSGRANSDTWQLWDQDKIDAASASDVEVPALLKRNIRTLSLHGRFNEQHLIKILRKRKAMGLWSDIERLDLSCQGGAVDFPAAELVTGELVMAHTPWSSGIGEVWSSMGMDWDNFNGLRHLTLGLDVDTDLAEYNHDPTLSGTMLNRDPKYPHIGLQALEIHLRSSESQHVDDLPHYLPCISAFADALLKIGGPTCEYTIKIIPWSAQEDVVANTAGIYLTRGIRSEMQRILGVERAEPGWKRMPKREVSLS
jgi:hypothetical protein